MTSKLRLINQPSRRAVPFLALFVQLCAAATVAANAQEITVQNEAGTSVKMTAAEIAGMPHQEISVDDHGKTVRFEGAPLRLVLEKAGVTFGETLRGKRLADCLLVEAADGYKAVIALPELDSGFTDRVILLAHMVAETERSDNEQVARVLSRQSYDCQFCLRTLPDGTFASARAKLATPSQLEQLGFSSSRIN
ncbi:MAG TPA: hypothetical protein VMT20_20205 [Terriglobia bacterium]|nr:hypothetical protein [Terriglobia bacterium]